MAHACSTHVQTHRHCIFIPFVLFSLSGPSSKFRHIQGNVQHRDTHITNLRGLSLTTPGECDGFCTSPHHVAVPLAIAGGQIAVFEVLTGP